MLASHGMLPPNAQSGPPGRRIVRQLETVGQGIFISLRLLKHTSPNLGRARQEDDESCSTAAIAAWMQMDASAVPFDNFLGHP